VQVVYKLSWDSLRKMAERVFCYLGADGEVIDEAWLDRGNVDIPLIPCWILLSFARSFGVLDK